MAFSFKDIKNNALRFITDKIANSYPDIASKYRNNNQNTSNLGSIPSHQNSTVIQPEPINITIPGKDGLPLRLPNRSNNPNNKVTAEDLYEVLDPYGIATESAKVLVHPRQQTRTPDEIQNIGLNKIKMNNIENKKNKLPIIPINPETIKQYGESWNYGENPELSTGVMEAPNYDGSYDYATMRNNNNTVNGLLADTYQDGTKNPWKISLNKRGIHSLEDVKNSTKASINTALMTLLRSNYGTYRDEMAKQGTDYPKLTGKLNYSDWYAADPELRNR